MRDGFVPGLREVTKRHREQPGLSAGEEYSQVCLLVQRAEATMRYECKQGRSHACVMPAPGDPNYWSPRQRSVAEKLERAHDDLIVTGSSNLKGMMIAHWCDASQEGQLGDDCGWQDEFNFLLE